ncbi:hypothetical protein [Sphingosinicella sp. BN140058]|uniref:hypothetical protein n=1 Tax=Sphingosinicella sp. BN140058 TaxID=1892855 RepID=UPI0010124AC1|nr:hypothetical protein [Sphingosinicella sp. BN140058]QAY80319.1 hypothetical protein ETR14_27125 [Sphingosinicella sp. BN140058]
MIKNFLAGRDDAFWSIDCSTSPASDHAEPHWPSSGGRTHIVLCIEDAPARQAASSRLTITEALSLSATLADAAEHCRENLPWFFWRKTRSFEISVDQGEQTVSMTIPNVPNEPKQRATLLLDLRDVLGLVVEIAQASSAMLSHVVSQPPRRRVAADQALPSDAEQEGDAQRNFPLALVA